MASPPEPPDRIPPPPQPERPAPLSGPDPSAGTFGAPRSTAQQASPPGPGGRNRKPWIIAGVATAVVLITLVTAVVLFHNVFNESVQGQVVLPFTGLGNVNGVAVDTSGAVYVTDSETRRVLKLAPGSTTATELPFTGLDHPVDVAVDISGAVYAADAGNNRVLKLASGAKSPIPLPFTSFNSGNPPTHVAVDPAGNVYCLDSVQLLKLPAGSQEMVYVQSGEAWISSNAGLAVDRSGAVYLLAAHILYYGKSETSVLKMEADRSQPSKLDPPIAGLKEPAGLAVDSAGALYIADKGTNRVVKLAPGAKSPIELPFVGLSQPDGVAVDGTGNVYVADTGNKRVLKLLAR